MSDRVEALDPREIADAQCNKEAWLRKVEFLERCSNEVLEHEYFVMMREELCGHFKNNAKVERRLIGAVLLARGVSSIPNLFGDIRITTL
jgi:hypothetical protein